MTNSVEIPNYLQGLVRNSIDTIVHANKNHSCSISYVVNTTVVGPIGNGQHFLLQIITTVCKTVNTASNESNFCGSSNSNNHNYDSISRSNNDRISTDLLYVFRIPRNFYIDYYELKVKLCGRSQHT